MSSSTTSPGSRLRVAAASVVKVCAEAEIGDVVASIGDEQLLRMMTDASTARDAIDLVLAAAAAEVARRSARELGYAGLAQRKGHRNVTSLVQNITGADQGGCRPRDPRGGGARSDDGAGLGRNR